MHFACGDLSQNCVALLVIRKGNVPHPFSVRMKDLEAGEEQGRRSRGAGEEERRDLLPAYTASYLKAVAVILVCIAWTMVSSVSRIR